MKRRNLLHTLAALPAAGGAAPAAAQTPASQPPQAAAPTLTLSLPSAAGEPRPGFLQPEEFAALRALAALLVPATGGKPGAIEAQAPEFLDFLLEQSPPARQQLWRTGLHRLDAEALRLHLALFAKLTAAQAAPILEPLKAKWTFYGPSEPFAQFLWVARNEILHATVNSREYAHANTGRRSSGGLDYYWRSMD